ncbi:MAG: hypothetical protein WC815_00750 [Vicinamibacterales bacterium]|jgi:hypothetical protein
MMPDDEKHRHDFKNQLGIILGFADVLLTDISPDDARRADVEEIQKAASAALALLALVFPELPVAEREGDATQGRSSHGQSGIGRDRG